MRSSRKNRSNGENVSHRRNVDQAKAARAKAAIKAAKSQSPKSVFKNRKFKAAVDLETPKSLLVNIRLKSVINLDTYSLLSRVEKERLVVLLPSCDQQKDQSSGMPILNSEALNNEFFAKACVEWCERLGEGEFLKDRQQGETSSVKVRQFGTLNGAKSHVIESLSTDAKLNRITTRHSTVSPKSPLLQHATRLRNGSGRRISVKLMSNRNAATPNPQRCRQRARNLRLEQIALDDDASLVSETSSESSLSVYGEQSRVGSSCMGYGGDGSSLATLGSNIRSRVCETSINRGLELFVHPALRDHDYADSMVECRSKTSRVSTARGRYRRRRKRKRVRRLKKPVSVGVLRSGGIALEMQGREFHAPVDMLASRCGPSLLNANADSVTTMNEVLHLNGAKVDCKDDVATNSHVLSFDNSLISNPSVKNNGRLNGACSPSKGYHGHSASAQYPANVSAHHSWLKENDANLNYVTRPHRLKTVQHLRKCEQTDGMPLIQIQGLDLFSRVSCAKRETISSVVRDACNSQVLPSPLCFNKTEFNACNRDFTSPASDSQRTTSDVDRSATDRTNSASLHRLDPVRLNESGVSDCRTKPDEKFFVKLIAIQKIPLDRETTEGQPNSCSGESDSSLDSIAAVLPRSIVQEVQRYAHAGGNVPYVDQHSSGAPVQCCEQLSVGHSLEMSFPSNGIGSHEDSVEHTSLLKQTDIRENSLLHENNMQNFKLIPDLRNRRTNCSALDTSECVWEAVRRRADAADRGH